MEDYDAKMGNKNALTGNMLPNICCKKVAFLIPKQFYCRFHANKKRLGNGSVEPLLSWCMGRTS